MQSAAVQPEPGLTRQPRARAASLHVRVRGGQAGESLQPGRQAASCIVRTNTVAFHTGPAPVHWLTQLRLSFHPFSPCTPPRLTTTWNVATTSPMATWAAQAGPVKVKPARAAYRPHHRAPARRLPVPLVIAKYADTSAPPFTFLPLCCLIL